MRRFSTLGLMVVALLSCCNVTLAQDKTAQAAILQKLADIESRLNDMDKRYEVRFSILETKLDERLNALETKLDERFNAVNIRIDAVNQRIDDKFNLIVGLLAIIAAFLALPYAPKLLERFKFKNDAQRLQGEIDQLKTQVAQLTRLTQQPTP